MQQRLDRHDQLHGIAEGGIDKSPDDVVGVSGQFLRECPEHRRQRDHGQEVQYEHATVGPTGGVGQIREREEPEQHVDLVIEEHLPQGLPRPVFRFGEAVVRLLRELGG
jgi:hypothetical protein